MISSLNVATNIMSDAQNTMVSYLIILNIMRFIVFVVLKSMTLYVPSELTELQEEKARLEKS